MDENSPCKGSSRFKPGQSGNRKGRPRKSTAQPESAFDELRNRKIVVQMDGIERELPLAEALLHKTLQQALAGGRMATRMVLKRILAHEASKAPSHRNLPVLLFEHSPQSVDEAMLILGVASEVCDTPRNDGGANLALEPWAVEASFARAKRLPLTEKDILALKRQTRDPESVAWPLGDE